VKGGDPFVFGRGGEEALALQQAGVPFDVVPGVSSAIAAPELAGIPVTHRGISSAFLVVSGHDDETFAAAVGDLHPGGLTLVVLMGVSRISYCGDFIGAGGLPPAAIVMDASTADQNVRGTLNSCQKAHAPFFAKKGYGPFSGTNRRGGCQAGPGPGSKCSRRNHGRKTRKYVSGT
jgi:siroheme synthase